MIVGGIEVKVLNGLNRSPIQEMPPLETSCKIPRFPLVTGNRVGTSNAL